MKIIHIGPANLTIPFQFGGAIERRIYEMSRQQARDGHEVSVFRAGNSAKSEVLDGVTFVTVACRYRQPLRDFEFQRKAAQLIRKRGPVPDVIHFHSQPEGAFVFRSISAKKVLSYDYFHFRRCRRRPHYFAYRRLLRLFDALLPVSMYCLDQSRQYWALEPSRFSVLHNGVNLQQFRPDPRQGEQERKEYGSAKKILLYVGRICRQKGTDILLDAYAELVKREAPIQLVIAGPIGQFGNTADPEDWESLMRKSGALWLGPVEEGRLAAIYNSCDVFVMPTRENEMFCMAAVEAQACGKPVIASNHGGLVEVVPGDCGVRFPAGDVDALQTACRGLLDDEDRLPRLAVHARANACKYGWEEICRSAYALYRA